MTAHRPIYETDATLRAEAAVAAEIKAAYGLGLRKMPRSYGVDFAATRGDDLVGLIEVKTRPTYGWDFFERSGYRIALQKWMDARELAAFLGVPFMLAVCASAETRIYVARKAGDWTSHRVIWAGRRDRGDPADMEPHIVISGSAFAPLPVQQKEAQA